MGQGLLHIPLVRVSLINVGSGFHQNWILAFLDNYFNIVCWVLKRVDWGLHQITRRTIILPKSPKNPENHKMSKTKTPRNLLIEQNSLKSFKTTKGVISEVLLYLSFFGILVILMSKIYTYIFFFTGKYPRNHYNGHYTLKSQKYPESTKFPQKYSEITKIPLKALKQLK